MNEFNPKMIRTLKLEVFLINFALYYAEESLTKKCEYLNELEKDLSIVKNLFVEDVFDPWVSLVDIKDQIMPLLEEDLKTKVVCVMNSHFGKIEIKQEIKKIVIKYMVDKVTVLIREKTVIIDRVLKDYEGVIHGVNKNLFLKDIVQLREDLLDIKANLSLAIQDKLKLGEIDSQDPQKLMGEIATSREEFDLLLSNQVNGRELKSIKEIRGIQTEMTRQLKKLLEIVGKEKPQSCRAFDIDKVNSNNFGKILGDKINKCLNDVALKVKEIKDKESKDQTWEAFKVDIHNITKGLIAD